MLVSTALVQRLLLPSIKHHLCTVVCKVNEGYTGQAYFLLI